MKLRYLLWFVLALLLASCGLNRVETSESISAGTEEQAAQAAGDQSDPPTMERTDTTGSVQTPVAEPPASPEAFDEAAEYEAEDLPDAGTSEIQPVSSGDDGRQITDPYSNICVIAGASAVETSLSCAKQDGTRVEAVVYDDGVVEPYFQNITVQHGERRSTANSSGVKSSHWSSDTTIRPKPNGFGPNAAVYELDCSPTDSGSDVCTLMVGTWLVTVWTQSSDSFTTGRMSIQWNKQSEFYGSDAHTANPDWSIAIGVQHSDDGTESGRVTIS